MNKSKGHIVWAQHTECNGELTLNTEFFERYGNVYRAPMSDAIMPDGYRTGRFVCSKKQFDMLKDLILSPFEIIES